MNYKKLHDSIISRAKARESVIGYTERHHIVLKSMGGDNSKDNLVILTAKEHYIIHWLLYKIHQNNATAFAWHRMTHGKGSVARYTSRTFEYAKIARIERMSGTNSPVYGKKLTKEHREKLSKAKLGKSYIDLGRSDLPMLGREVSAETREKLSKAGKGRRWTEQTKAKLSKSRMGELNPMFARVVSEETKLKISSSLKKSLAIKIKPKKLTIRDC